MIGNDPAQVFCRRCRRHWRRRCRIDISTPGNLAQLVKVRYPLSLAAYRPICVHLLRAPARIFKQRGIGLDISRGYGLMAAIQAVSTGQFEMGGA